MRSQLLDIVTRFVDNLIGYIFCCDSSKNVSKKFHILNETLLLLFPNLLFENILDECN